MTDTVYHPTTPELAAWRKDLAPNTHRAFEEFSRAVFTEGALSEKTKQLIAVAAAHITQCPYCITGHTRLASRKGASPQEIMEAIWVAAEMRAGGAYAHSTLALHALDDPPSAAQRRGVDGAAKQDDGSHVDEGSADKEAVATVSSAVMQVCELNRSVNYYRDAFLCRVAVHEPDSALLLTPGGFQIYMYARGGASVRDAVGRVGVKSLIWAAETETELQRIAARLRTYDPATDTRTMNGVTFVDACDPDGIRVMVAYPSPAQLPRELIAPRFRG